jgi:hypothetical protein
VIPVAPAADPPEPSAAHALLERLPPRLRHGFAGLILLVCALGLAASLLAALAMVGLFAYSVSPFATLAVAGIALGGVLGVTLALLANRPHDHTFRRGLLGLFRRAEAGDPGARLRLARAYLKGAPGLARDESQALWWMRRLAEEGNARAAYQVALWVDQGVGQPRNRRQALEWLRRAAEGGCGPARHLLGHWEEAAGNDPSGGHP